MISTRTASNGKITKPSSVLCKIPAFSSACTSPCTPFTSRSPRRLSDRERPRPCHRPQQFPAFCRHDLEKQFRGSKANAGTLLPARECGLSAAFDFLERGNFERHSFHFRPLHA